MADKARRKYVVSASRRTDMLACDPDRLFAALTGQLPTTRGLEPERVHTLLLSTKDFRPLLDHQGLSDVVKRCDQVCMNLTITGLGGTRLEPRVPNHKLLMNRVEELVDYIGDPRRIMWCFSPILSWEGLSNFSLELFESIATPVAMEGIKKSILTFYIPYGNSQIVPDLINRDKRILFAQKVDAIAQSLGMHMSICKMKNYHRLRCVDMQWYAELHPEKDDSVVEHYQKMKKPTGHCRDAIWDIGWYRPRCGHACKYCYGLTKVE
ncbi:MAG TPA: DUF1848 family protein [Cyclobacteriaceae bacterium]|nr:DUF1848 family protein [Cyclobacteriaceae bacterium]